MNCQNFDELYWLWTYKESLPGGEDGFLKHLETCPRCHARKVELDRLQALLVARTAVAPKAEALQQARLQLLARLRTEKKSDWTASFADWLRERMQPRVIRWEMGLATAMLFLGLFLGRNVLYHPTGTPLEVMPASLADQGGLLTPALMQDLLQGKSNISGLRIKPVQPQEGVVEISFRAARDYSIQGKSDDQFILELLGWAIKHEENSGVRLQSVQELARATTLSPKARQVLAYALVNDQNAGVRLKAMEALGSAGTDPLSEQAILNALLKDPNPAVRIYAIDVLLQGERSPKPEKFLLQAAQADSNEYVRAQVHKALLEYRDEARLLESNQTDWRGVSLEEVVKGESK